MYRRGEAKEIFASDVYERSSAETCSNTENYMASAENYRLHAVKLWRGEMGRASTANILDDPHGRC